MAKTNAKSASEKAHSKSEAKSKLLVKKSRSSKDLFGDNDDSDSIEQASSPIESQSGRSPAGNKKTGNNIENPIINKYNLHSQSNPVILVDKLSFAKIIRDSFSRNPNFIDANSIVSKYNTSTYDDLKVSNNNTSSTPAPDDDKFTPTDPSGSSSKIRAKRSYQSILSFFRRNDEKEKSNNVISLQNIEPSSSDAGSAYNNIKLEQYYDQPTEFKSNGIPSSSCITNSNKNINGSVVQNQIIAMINKCEAEYHSLEKKIYMLETNYLSRAPDSTGLTRGWNRCGILSSSSNITFTPSGPKKQKVSSFRTKSGSSYGLPEILDSDRVFSSTSYATKYYSNIKELDDNTE